MASDKKQAPKGAKGEAEVNVVKVKDLTDRVVAASGGKKAEVRKAVDAVLQSLADALEKGEVLALPPLGRLSLVKRKTTPKGDVMTLKLRQGGAGKSGKEALAADGE